MFGIKKNKTGWIGVDLGTSHVKVAQVRRSQGVWQLSSAAIVPRSLAWDLESIADGKYSSSAAEMLAAADLRKEIVGRQVAATLPMAVCQVHQVEGNLSGGANRGSKLRQLVEAATCQPAGHLQCAAWPAEVPDKGNAPVKSNIIAVPQTWTDELSQEIARCGWSCQTIDGLPLALARAVDMVLPKGNTETWAALDWGYSSATFCVVHQRRPVYVRPLKDCGFHKVVNAIAHELGVSASEGLQLLEQHNLATSEQDESARVILESIAQPLRSLEFELSRTLSHISSLRRNIVPQGVYLFGGGSAINGIAELLSQRLSLPYRVWQLPGQSPDSGTARITNLLGPAIALSALAWEK